MAEWEFKVRVGLWLHQYVLTASAGLGQGFYLGVASGQVPCT